jgi:hypothetical protein
VLPPEEANTIHVPCVIFDGKSEDFSTEHNSKRAATVVVTDASVAATRWRSTSSDIAASSRAAICTVGDAARASIRSDPVRRWLGMEHGDVSLGLERAVTDLTTRMTFGDAVSSMQEHHGQVLDRTKAQRITYRVGEQAAAYLGERRAKAREAQLSGDGAMASQLVFTADGGMIPVGVLTRPTEDVLDARTPRTPVRQLAKGTRTIAGREGRLIAVHPAQRQDQRIVDLHIAPYDDVAYTGERMRAAAAAAGLHMNVDANSGDQVQVAVAVKRRRPRLQGQRKPPRAI